MTSQKKNLVEKSWNMGQMVVFLATYIRYEFRRSIHAWWKQKMQSRKEKAEGKHILDTEGTEALAWEHAVDSVNNSLPNEYKGRLVSRLVPFAVGLAVALVGIMYICGGVLAFK